MEVTRTKHTRHCEACDGSGEVIVNNTNPYGYGPDPQCDEPVECEACEGKGEVTVWVDPLVKLKAARWNPLNHNYKITRMRAMRPVSGLAMANMRAMAAMCVNRVEQAQATYRRAVAA